MLIVRPVEFNDIKAIEYLAESAGASVSTLPSTHSHLQKLVEATQQALRRAITKPAGETYHFVLSDINSGQVLGIAGMNAAVGVTAPFYSYRLQDIVHASDDLQIHNLVPALTLCHDYTGYTSLCTFYLLPEAETPQTLALLSRARLLFLAQHRHRFADRILAELQGVVDEQGRSPFWEGLGQHFFTMDMTHANYLTGVCDKSFIADLMPRFPVYTPLLSRKARSVIGEVRPDRMPAVDLLESEGFRYEEYIDIFDAGPTLEARIDTLTTVSTSQRQAVSIDETVQGTRCLVANTGTTDFRCLSTRLNREQPAISAAIADALRVRAGDPIRFCQ
ncbi:arginine N-succinyltransferase [Candidatus Sororendozoicomonas aggregata]|uniref:arginine N-succinyltransferase n=1 Tax=Candidatus Sororendozoicomonas aggregata TaxID=3073239 RepID=UPI002ED5708C